MLDRCAPAKPARGSARKAKARGKRQEGALAKSVRAQCVERDGPCVMQFRTSLKDWFHMDACFGPSEWAHIGPHRRCHTRRMAPEARHTTKGSAMLCQRHHRAYDAHEFDIEPLTDMGMDGPFSVVPV